MEFRVYNKHLDHNLWDEHKQLNSEVRAILLKIARDYYEGNEDIEGALVDAYIVGSSANYNWTPDSDLDLHLVVDSKKLDLDEATARTFFELMANKWNQNHDIKIKGHNIELYLQDIDHKVRSSGIYSLMDGEWVTEPYPEKVEIDEEEIKLKYRNMVRRIEDAIQAESVAKMKKVMEDLRNQRNTGLDKSGEFSAENIVFKMLRKFGYIEKLKDATHQVYDREMTLTEGIKNPHDLIIGYITPALKIKAKDYSQIQRHDQFTEVRDWYGVTAWRFRRDLNLLFWWQNELGPITQNERDAVIDYLESHHGARNITQKMLVLGATTTNDNWDIAHGVKENDDLTEMANLALRNKIPYSGEVRLKEEEQKPWWITGITNHHMETASEKYDGHINNVTHRGLSFKYQLEGELLLWRYINEDESINFLTPPTDEERQEVYKHLKDRYNIVPKKFSSYGQFESLLMESPKQETLKNNKKPLTDEERKLVMASGAVWHHGPNGEETPAVWKAVVDGKTWYVCNTHRAIQIKPTLKGAIKAFEFIETTA